MKNLHFFIAILCVQQIFSQSVKIVDAENDEPVPYANIRLNNSESLVSNAEGYFSVPASQSGDDATVTVSYIGYNNQTLSLATLKDLGHIIRLTPSTYSLDTVIVPNERPDPQKIMAEVNKRLKTNYTADPQPLKNTIFYRESKAYNPSKLDFEIDKSTGFTNKQLDAANRDLNIFSKSLISHPPRQYVDVLCNYYSAIRQKNGKQVYDPKLEIVKATKLRDENRSTELDDLQKGFGHIVLQHLDTTKNYRIKSGLFGSRDTISLRKDKSNKTKKKATQIASSKSSLMNFMIENNPLNGRIDFITNHANYDFTYEGAQYSAENEFIYILGFKPRKSKAKYSGKVYVSETDYAVVRTDYTLANGKTLGGVNMKLLLGVKASENVSSGTLIYKQSTVGDGYYLHYATVEDGQYIYVNRPIKFIELADEEKDVVAFDLKMELNTLNRMEFLNIARAPVNEKVLDLQKEEDFVYTPLKRYNPELWKEYGVIAPVEEMKRFQVVD